MRADNDRPVSIRSVRFTDDAGGTAKHLLLAVDPFGGLTESRRIFLPSRAAATTRQAFASHGAREQATRHRQASMSLHAKGHACGADHGRHDRS
jgi:hypothetical protein